MGVNIRGQAPIPRDAGQNIYYVCISPPCVRNYVNYGLTNNYPLKARLLNIMPDWRL